MLLRVTVDRIGITQIPNTSEKACQNGWGIFSVSGPGDGRIVWVCTGRTGHQKGKVNSQQAGRHQ